MPSYAVSLLWFAGMIVVFVGERLIGAGSARWLTALGVALVLFAEATRNVRGFRAEGSRRAIERMAFLAQAIGTTGLFLYFVQSDLSGQVLAQPLDRGWPKLQVVLAALYPALLLSGMTPLLLIELAYSSMARAPRLEVGRVKDALYSGLGVAAAVVFVFGITYTATARDHKIDLSYFRTARPGEATRKIVGSLDAPVQVAIFFPPANDVHEEVASYFKDLAAESKFLDVKEFDHAADPAKAKEYAVSGNGIVVIARAGRREQLSIGLELDAARNQLANLDKEVSKRLLLVAKPQRTVYLVIGHGERAADPMNDTDKRPTLRELRDLLYQQGYTVKNLSAADGLAQEVPGDAAVVLLIGPQKPLLPEEAASLVRYVERGGRLFAALDPEAGLDEKALLAPLGLKFSTTMLANDQIYARKSNQPSDRYNVVSGSFSSHASVTTLSRLGLRAPLAAFGVGSFEEAKDHAKELSVSFTVHALPSTWNDTNGNFEFDAATGEVRKSWELAAAVTRKPTTATVKPSDPRAVDEGRAIVLGDADAVSDGIVPNPGNAYFVLDGLKWLLGDEAIAGEVNSEVDAPILHTKKQDVVWFYSTIFLAPAVALGIGFIATRRRRSGKRASGKEAA